LDLKAVGNNGHFSLGKMRVSETSHDRTLCYWWKLLKINSTCLT